MQQFEIRCKKSKHEVYGIDAGIWNKYFAGHTFVFDTNDCWCIVDINFFGSSVIDGNSQFYFPKLSTFESSRSLVTESDRKAMEYWLIYPQYKRRVQ